MKALSVRQPWAWLIVHGYKDVENRTWKLPQEFHRGQRIYVHASSNPVPQRRWGVVASCVRRSSIPDIARFAEEQAYVLASLESSGEFGAIVGEVEVVGCVTESPSPWFTGPYGFLLTNPVPYDDPIPCKGKRHFFDPEI